MISGVLQTLYFTLELVINVISPVGLLYVYLYPITMATDSISRGNKSHARRVISTGSCGFQLEHNTA